MFDAFGCPIHFSLTRTTDAVVEPVTLELAKSALKISTDSTYEDGLLDNYLRAARLKVESDTNRSLINTSWTISLDKVPSRRRRILLPIGPVSSVTSITSYSTADVSSVVATSVYRVDTGSLPARIVLRDAQEWPSGLRPENALDVLFVAGYGTTAESVTDSGLIQAILLLAGHWYMNREAVVTESGLVSKEIELAYKALTQPLWVTWL